jgi:PAS domain S-box-containing protein
LEEYFPLLEGVPGYLALLAVALAARFFGFVPAITLTAGLAAVLWFNVLPSVFPGRPLPFLIARLVLFIVAAIVIATIARQKGTELREAEQRYESLVEMAPDGIGVSDADGNILFVNDALARIVGARSPAELVGRKTIDFIHPDFREVTEKRIGGLRADRPAPPLEVKWITLDGRVIDVETAGVPVHKNGRLLFQGFVRDLTERKKTAAKLEESGQRMRALFDAAFDAILFVDSSGHYVDANPAASELLGYTHEEILSMSVGDFTPSEKQGAITAIWDDVKSGRSVRGEFSIMTKSGKTRDIEYATVSNVLPGLHCALMHDITARKEAERSVRQLSARLLHLQDEERRRIARQLHDTTAQNLAALRMNLSRISKSPVSDSASRASIEESIALTDASIAEIRTLSYLLHPPMIEEAGLLPTLRWYAHGFEERSGIKVALELPPELDPLPLDLATTLFRIVQEGLTNVQRHSGSTVARIRLERQPQGLHLEIEDEGHGMPRSLRDDETMLAAYGVGIAGMRERVREHGGQMHIRSHDSGTIVSVTLPAFES